MAKPEQVSTVHPRPYWHVDAKWVSAIIAIILLAATLPVISIYQITAKDSATNIIAHAMAGLTAPKGLDDAEGIDEARARVRQKGSETITFGGVSATITAADVESLSPRQLRLKIFSAYAEKFYDKGAGGLAAEQNISPEQRQKFEKDASFIAPLTKAGHEQIGRVLLILILANLVFLGLLVFFSHRVGRLVSPGLILFIVGLPGLLFAAIASQQTGVPSVARSGGEGESALGMAGVFASFVGPLVIGFFRQTYLTALALGAALLITALITKLVIHFKTRGAKVEN